MSQFRLLLCFYLGFIFSPGNAQDIELQTDSIKRLIELSDSDSLKMEWYNQLRKIGLRSNFSEAMVYADNYLQLANKLDLDFKIAIGHFYKGNIYIQLTEYEKAVPHLMNTLDYFEAQNDTIRMGRIFNSIAAAYENLGNDSLTLSYFRKAYEMSSALNQSPSMAIALNNMSNVYVRANDYKKGAELLNESIRLLKMHPEYVDMYNQISSNLGNLYQESGQFAKAEEVYLRNLDATKSKDVFGYAANLRGLGRVVLEQGKTKKALLHLEEAYQLIVDNDFYILKEDVEEDLVRAYEAIGEPGKALAVLKRLTISRDSVFNLEKSQALNDALQKYEAEKQQQQIQILSSQNELKDLKLRQGKRERWAYIIGLLGLGLMAVLIFRNYHNKVKTNQKLEEKNKVIAKALEDKNLLLKEIHHRVKNNLQVISSLLNLQSRYIEDDSALEAITESRNRVQSMSLLHQNLYQDNNLTGVEVQKYFNQLFDSLFHTYNIKPGKITLQKEIQALMLDVDTLIPLGLIANELVSNALKYAFPGETRGIVTISLREEGTQLLLQVKDDGIGVSDEVFNASKSFGNRMINAFITKLQGKMNIDNQSGTVVEIAFRNYQKVS